MDQLQYQGAIFVMNNEGKFETTIRNRVKCRTAVEVTFIFYCLELYRSASVTVRTTKTVFCLNALCNDTFLNIRQSLLTQITQETFHGTRL